MKDIIYKNIPLKCFYKVQTIMWSTNCMYLLEYATVFAVLVLFRPLRIKDEHNCAKMTDF